MQVNNSSKSGVFCIYKTFSQVHPIRVSTGPCFLSPTFNYDMFLNVIKITFAFQVQSLVLLTNSRSPPCSKRPLARLKRDPLPLVYDVASPHLITETLGQQSAVLSILSENLALLVRLDRFFFQLLKII